MVISQTCGAQSMKSIAAWSNSSPPPPHPPRKKKHVGGVTHTVARQTIVVFSKHLGRFHPSSTKAWILQFESDMSNCCAVHCRAFQKLPSKDTDPSGNTSKPKPPPPKPTRCPARCRDLTYADAIDIPKHGGHTHTHARNHSASWHEQIKTRM